MVTYTPGNSLPYPEAGDSVKVASRDFRDLAVATDAAITAVTQASKWSKGDLSSSADLDTLVTPGTYGVVSLAITGRPPVEAYGEVTVTRAGVAVMQSYRTSQNPPQVWGRRGNTDGTSWGAWVRTDAGAATGGADLAPIVEEDRGIQDRRTSEVTVALLNATIPEPGKPHADLSFHWDEPTGTYYEKIRVNGVHGGILTKHYGEADQPAPASVVRVPPLFMRQYHDLYGGTVLFNDAGFTDTYAVRGLQISQGVLIRGFETGGRGSHAIGFRADGSYGMYSHFDGDTGASVLADGVTETFGFGPFLVRGGVPQYHSGDPLYDFMDIDSGRQILGVNADGEIVLATVHGKSSRYGVSLDDSADVAIRAGMVDAIMLDGGGSAQTMVRGIPLHASSDQPTDRGIPIVGRLDVAVGDPRLADLLALLPG